MRPNSLMTVCAIAAAGCASVHASGPEESGAPRLESAEAKELARLEDERSLGAGRVEELTRASAPGVRQRALLALARIQQSHEAGVIAPGLEDPSPEVRATAAFALGQLGLAWTPIDEQRRSFCETRLLERLLYEREPAVRDALLEALGKVGGPLSLQPLTAALGRKGREAERAALALALLARSSQGKLESVEAVPALLEQLRKADAPSARFAAGHALWRYKEPSAREALAAGLSDPAPEVRAVCAKGLYEVGETGPELAALSARVDDPDPSVAAEAARALTHLAQKCEASEGCAPLDALLASDQPWGKAPAVTAAIVDEKLSKPWSAALYRKMLDAYAAVLGRTDDAAFARAHCSAALACDRAGGASECATSAPSCEPGALVPTCGGRLVSEDERAAYTARAIAESAAEPALRVARLEALARGRASPVRAAVARALGSVGPGASGPVVLELLKDADARVVCAAAETVEGLPLASAGPALFEALDRTAAQPDAQLCLVSAIAAIAPEAAEPRLRERLANPNQEIAAAAAQALEKLGFKADAPRWKPGPYSMAEVPPRPVARLVTNRGAIRILLWESDSPQTVHNFVYLARKRFYDGLTFHRFVPGFVIQGGDPNGDGSGGPGYAVRCEMNPRRYRTGSVGMALSGKDTGGSQFFIALTPQPHLDGRYTNFGQVVEGMDVVSRLVEGDRILEARIEEAASARQ